MRLVTIAPPTNRTIVAAQDSQGYNPCIGYEGAIEDPAYRNGDYAIYCGPDELERVAFAPSFLRFKNPNTDMVSLSNHALRKKGDIEITLSSPPRAENGGGDPVFGFTSAGNGLPDLRTYALTHLRTFLIPSAHAFTPVTLISLSKEPKKLSPTPAKKFPSPLAGEGKGEGGAPPVYKLPATLSPFSNKQPVLLQRAARRRPQFGVAQSICNTSGVGCCTIASDGSFQCYPQSDNETTLCIQVVNIVTGAVSECVNEDPNKNFLWMRSRPLANTRGPQDPLEKVVFAAAEKRSTENNVVKIKEVDGTFQVVGDYNTSYKHANVNAYDANGIVYHPDIADLGIVDAGTLSLKRPLSAINIHEVEMIDDLNEVQASFERRSEPETREYTALKLVNDKVMFGIEPRADIGDPNNKAKIFDAYDTTRFDPLPGEAGAIAFDTVADASTPFKRTITFDLDAQDFALVLFEDEDGNCKLRMTDGDALRFGGATPFGSCNDYELKDVQIYYENASSSEPGKALLLDARGNRIALVEFNKFRDRARGIEREVRLVSWVALGAGKNPQAFALNTDNTRAYIVNEGAESVTILGLTNADGSPKPVPTIESEIEVEDYFPEKDFTYKPTHLAYHSSEAGEYLVIGAEDMKGSVVIPVGSQLQQPRPGNLNLMREGVFDWNNLYKIPPDKNKSLQPPDKAANKPAVTPNKPAIQPKPVYTIPSKSNPSPAAGAKQPTK